jgi:hypothetical protein
MINTLHRKITQFSRQVVPRISMASTFGKLIAIERFHPEKAIDLCTITPEETKRIKDSGEKGVLFSNVYDTYAEKTTHPSIDKSHIYGFPKPTFWNAYAWDMPQISKSVCEPLSMIWNRLLTLGKLHYCIPIIAGGWIENCIIQEKITEADKDCSEEMSHIRDHEYLHNDVAADSDANRQHWRDIMEESIKYVNISGKRDIDVFLCYQGKYSEAVAKELEDLIVDLAKNASIVAMSKAGATLVCSLDMVQLRTDNNDGFVFVPRKIQFLLAKDRTPDELINSFDIDCCAAYYDGKSIFAVPRAIRAWQTRVNIFSPRAITVNYEGRALKYFRLGYDFCFPAKYGFDPANIDESLPRRGGGIMSILPFDPEPEKAREKVPHEDPMRRTLIALSEPDDGHRPENMRATGSELSLDYTTIGEIRMPLEWRPDILVIYVNKLRDEKTLPYVYHPGGAGSNIVIDGDAFYSGLRSFLNGHYAEDLVSAAFGDRIFQSKSRMTTRSRAILRKEELKECEGHMDALGALFLEAKKRSVKFICSSVHPSLLKLASRDDTLVQRSNLQRLPRQRENWFCVKVSSKQDGDSSQSDESRAVPEAASSHAACASSSGATSVTDSSATLLASSKTPMVEVIADATGKSVKSDGQGALIGAKAP